MRMKYWFYVQNHLYSKGKYSREKEITRNKSRYCFICFKNLRLGNHSCCARASANNSVLQKCNAHIKLIQCYIFRQTSRANSAGRAPANPVLADDFTRSGRTSLRSSVPLFICLASGDAWSMVLSLPGNRTSIFRIFYLLCEF